MKGSGYEGWWWCDKCKAGRRHRAWLLGCTQTRGYMTPGHEVTRSRNRLPLALANLRCVRGARLRRGHGGHQAGLLGAGAGVVAAAAVAAVAAVPGAVAGAVPGVAAHAAVLLPVLVLAEGAAVARQAAARAGLARRPAAVPTRLRSEHGYSLAYLCALAYKAIMVRSLKAILMFVFKNQAKLGINSQFG